MKLKKFKERDNKKIGVIVFTLVCLFLISGAILYRTFAIFEVRTNQNVIKGTVQGMGDIEFAFYIDDKIVKTAPKAEEKENYVFDEEKSNCTNEASVYWDYQEWGPLVKNLTATKTKCYLKFKTEYNETILNGAVPKLKGELTPVILEEDGTVKRADTTTSWYNYGNQKWANAVILKNEKIDGYAPGEVISKDNIESYFVWIPRYKYQIWNGEEETSQFKDVTNLGTITSVTDKPELDKAKEIKIEFENKHMPVSNGNLKNQWLTHPAFTSIESNGFWVGKFETSNVKNVVDNSINPEAVQIKPNVSSWRNINVSNAFYTSYNYQRDLESHMMKNMEWGAIAYLTNSKYGRCPDGKCTEVRINNNSDYKTGNSAVNAPTCGYNETSISCNQYGTDINIVNGYNTLESVASSTTNNYYGVFDMAGGGWEYTMGVMKSANDELSYLTTADFDKLEKKYYDLYDYMDSEEEYSRGMLGDATKEVGPMYKVTYSTTTWRTSSWYADEANFTNATTNMYSGGPWLLRGGHYADGTNGGMFAFSGWESNGYNNGAFRIILTP